MLTLADLRALPYLLDRLLQYEEALIESHTLDGEHFCSRCGALDFRVVSQARRVWRRVNRITRALEQDLARPLVAESTEKAIGGNA